MSVDDKEGQSSASECGQHQDRVQSSVLADSWSVSGDHIDGRVSTSTPAVAAVSAQPYVPCSIVAKSRGSEASGRAESQASVHISIVAVVVLIHVARN